MDMYTAQNRHWCFIHLHCFLIGCLVGSSSPTSPSVALFVSSAVGNQAVLPCSWKSRLDGVTPTACHIQWKTPVDTVFEQRGEVRWQAAEFTGRVEVPEERLGAGDCSLIMNDVQFGDTGLYESFMVVNGGRMKKRVFIQSVKLAVYDHKTRQSHGPGEEMVVELHTPRSVRVVYQNRNSSEWSVLWMRGDENTQRLQKHSDREQLTVKGLKMEDEGTYKVLDEQGLAVSTVQLTVEASTKGRKDPQFQERQELVGDATKHSCTFLLMAFSLIVSSQIGHLF